MNSEWCIYSVSRTKDGLYTVTVLFSSGKKTIVPGLTKEVKNNFVSVLRKYRKPDHEQSELALK